MGSFVLPPLTLPPDIIAKQLSIDLPAGIDANFFNGIRGLASGSATGLFTNPLASQISDLQGVVSDLNTLQGAAGAVGAGATLNGIISSVTEPIQIFTNMGTNIVPTQLTMSSTLSAAVQSAGASLPGIGAGDAPTLGPFLTALGIPSMGTVMNISLSQFSLNQMCGTIDPTNPLPLLNNFSSMLTNMTNGANALLSNAQSVVSNLLTLPSNELASGLSSALTNIQGNIASSIGGPIASFGGDMFLAIKDQMATGLANSMRYMIETNYALKFMTTGEGSTEGGGFGGILGPGISTIIANNPSNINTGHIIP
jgi:hypothetical protein